MAIISTFDPKYKRKILGESIAEMGAENVIYIKKSRLFLWVKVLFPFFLRLVVLVTLLSLSVIYINIVRLQVALCVILVGVFAIPGFKILKYYLDYCMDFAIITPKYFLRYDQTGFFKRASKTIDLRHVRSVYVKKAGFINSIFNNGNIIILSEGSNVGPKDMENLKDSPGEIMFRYVYNPEYYSERIQDLLSSLSYDGIND